MYGDWEFFDCVDCDSFDGFIQRSHIVQGSFVLLPLFRSIDDGRPVSASFQGLVYVSCDSGFSLTRSSHIHEATFEGTSSGSFEIVSPLETDISSRRGTPTAERRELTVDQRDFLEPRVTFNPDGITRGLRERFDQYTQLVGSHCQVADRVPLSHGNVDFNRLGETGRCAGTSSTETAELAGHVTARPFVVYRSCPREPDVLVFYVFFTLTKGEVQGLAFKLGAPDGVSLSWLCSFRTGERNARPPDAAARAWRAPAFTHVGDPAWERRLDAD